MSNWFSENLYKDFYAQTIKKDKVLVCKDTTFQKIEIFENGLLGKVLTLDGVVQTSERDEYFYHEMFVHVTFISFYLKTGTLPKNVLIIGGGDGGILREALKYSSLQQAVMIELDEDVVHECSIHMPQLSGGAFEDKRADVRFEDGIKYVESAAKDGKKFDIILVDSTDPVGVAEPLFTEVFYENCKKCLTPNGILSTQSGVPFFQNQEMLTVRSKLSKTFPITTFFIVPVPLYVGSFMVLSFASSFDPKQFTIEECQKAFLNTKLTQLKYYNPEIHFASFLLPNYIIK